MRLLGQPINYNIVVCTVLLVVITTVPFGAAACIHASNMHAGCDLFLCLVYLWDVLCDCDMCCVSDSLWHVLCDWFVVTCAVWLTHCDMCCVIDSFWHVLCDWFIVTMTTIISICSQEWQTWGVFVIQTGAVTWTKTMGSALHLLLGMSWDTRM